MSSPAGVGDAGMRAGSGSVQLAFQVFDLAYGFFHKGARSIGVQSDTAGVVPAILQPFQAGQKDGSRISFPDIGNYSTHTIALVKNDENNGEYRNR